MRATVYITFVQTLCGTAKDLVKIAGKSVTKLTTTSGDDYQGRLFRLVSYLTGAKNSVKAFGYFIGAFFVWLPGLGYELGLVIVVLFLIPFAEECNPSAPS